MGQSKATRRIERIMTKLRMEGKLDEPFYPNGKPPETKQLQNRQRCRGCRQFKGFGTFDKDGYCTRCATPKAETCCVGLLSRLPDGVVPCLDCPLT